MSSLLNDKSLINAIAECDEQTRTTALAKLFEGLNRAQKMREKFESDFVAEIKLAIENKTHRIRRAPKVPLM
jgi:hypothetical protein